MESKTFFIRSVVLLLFVLVTATTVVNLRNTPSPVTLQTTQNNQISQNDLITKTDGFLWVDRETNQYVVTLGSVNGLYPGARLDVYHRDRQIGAVEVDVVFESIAYVHADEGEGLFDLGDYYKVALGQ